MPQFNPDDGSLPNQGIPERLLKIYEGAFPVEFPVTIIKNAEAVGFDTEPKLNDVKSAVAGIPGIDPALLGNTPAFIYYEDGSNYTSWDHGNEELFTGSPEVVMTWFGAERVLDIRFDKDPSVIFNLALKSGTVIHLKHPLLEEWQVRIPPMKGRSQPALLILFRRPI